MSGGRRDQDTGGEVESGGLGTVAVEWGQRGDREVRGLVCGHIEPCDSVWSEYRDEMRLDVIAFTQGELAGLGRY